MVLMPFLQGLATPAAVASRAQPRADLERWPGPQALRPCSLLGLLRAPQCSSHPGLIPPKLPASAEGWEGVPIPPGAWGLQCPGGGGERLGQVGCWGTASQPLRGSLEEPAPAAACARPGSQAGGGTWQAAAGAGRGVCRLRATASPAETPLHRSEQRREQRWELPSPALCLGRPPRLPLLGWSALGPGTGQGSGRDPSEGFLLNLPSQAAARLGCAGHPRLRRNVGKHFLAPCLPGTALCGSPRGAVWRPPVSLLREGRVPPSPVPVGVQ